MTTTPETTPESQDPGRKPGGRIKRAAPVLSGAFSGASAVDNRADGLRGLLAPRPPQQTPHPPPEPVEESPPAPAVVPTPAGAVAPAAVPTTAPAAPAQPTTSRPPAAAKKGKAKATGPAAAGETQRRVTNRRARRKAEPKPAISAKLPFSLKRRLERYTDRTRRDYARVLLEALKLHRKDLDTILDTAMKKQRPQPPAEVDEDELFPPRPEPIVSSEGTLQVNFTTREVERQIIDAMFDQHAHLIPHRTAFIVAVLEHHFAEREPAIPEDFLPFEQANAKL